MDKNLSLEELLSSEELPDKIEISQNDLKKLIVEYKGLKNLLESERSTWFKANENLEKAYLELGEKEKELQDKNDLIEKDLEIAKRIQKAIVNTEFMSLGNEFKVAFYYNPIDEIGGELFDIIRVGKNKFGFLMADVSGSGVSAALISTMTKVCFNLHNHYILSTGEIVERVNNDMYKFIGDINHYVTSFYATLDLETDEFQFSNAGHFPAILIKENDINTLDECKGTFIGLMDKGFWDTKTLSFKRGDKILLYNNGVIESRNKFNEIYSEERLLKFARENYKMPLKEFVNTLIEDVGKFTEGMPQMDDIAVLLIEYMDNDNS